MNGPREHGPQHGETNEESSSVSENEQIEPRLEAAFEQFGELSERLESSYRALQARVEELTSELTSAQLRRAAERRERERLEARLAELMVLLPAGVVVVGPAGDIREINPMAEDLLGGAGVGERFGDRAPAEIADVPPGNEECTLACGRVLSVSKRPLGCGERLLVLSDVTETRRLQGALERRERVDAVAELAAGLAHQLRTPLATALLHAHRLRRTVPAEDEFLVGLAERLRDGLVNIEETVEASLRFARGTARGEELVEVPELLAELASTADAQLSGVELQVSCDCPELALRINRAVLVPALADLVANADHASDGPVRVLLEARADGADVALTIADDGPGIPDALRRKVFEPFFSTRESGTGLGLAILRASIEGHGGEIECTDSPLGGAAFTLRLPLAVPERPANRPQLELVS